MQNIDLCTKVVENIEMNQRSLYSRLPGCLVTTYYYVGFVYMMMRRYADAIQTLTNVLQYVQRIQSKQNQDQINKKTDKMFLLLAICLVLHPQRVDESLLTVFKDKNYAEKINKMQRGDLDGFKECFMLSSPKFLFPLAPDIRHSINKLSTLNYHMEPLKLQMKAGVNVFCLCSLI